MVASLAQPGGNVTGLSLQQTDVGPKRLELLREALPSLRGVAILGNVGYSAPLQEMAEVQQAAQMLGFTVVTFGIRRAEDIEPAFDVLKGGGADAPSANLLPFDFRGVWIGANFGDNLDDNLCRKTDWSEHRTDRLINITAGSIEMWESGCDILTVETGRSSLPGRRTIQIESACGGEGMTWRSRDVLEVQRVQGRRALMMTHVRTP
jgi:ABC transporter substrate binding protein